MSRFLDFSFNHVWFPLIGVPPPPIWSPMKTRLGCLLALKFSWMLLVVVSVLWVVTVAKDIARMAEQSSMESSNSFAVFFTIILVSPPPYRTGKRLPNL